MSEKNKKKAKHSLIALILFVLLTVTLSIGGTIAYFTHIDADTNKLQVGFNEIEIEENFVPPTELTSGDNLFEKQVKITNTGNVDCYVRVFMEFSEGTIDAMSKLSANGKDYYTSEEYKTTNTPDGWVFVSKEYNPVLRDYYYYTEPLAPGKSTTLLLYSVKTTFPSAEEVDDFEIIVYSESVQTLDKNGNPFTGENAWEDCWNEFIDYVYEEPVLKEPENYTVKFIFPDYSMKLSNGSDVYDEYELTVKEGTVLSVPPSPVPEMAYKGNFIGWYLDEEGMNAYDFSNPVISNLMLYAIYESENHEDPA